MIVVTRGCVGRLLSRNVWNDDCVVIDELRLSCDGGDCDGINGVRCGLVWLDVVIMICVECVYNVSVVIMMCVECYSDIDNVLNEGNGDDDDGYDDGRDDV